MKCKICEYECNDWNMLSKHIKIHKYTSEQYYLEFIGILGICEVCHSPTPYKGLKLGYNKYCSVSCAGKSPTKLEKYKETCIAKYGTDNAIKNDKILEKRISTNINKYGTLHPMQNNDIKLKYKNTLINKYGYDNVFNVPNIADKIHYSNIERYGYSNPILSDTIKSKVRNTVELKSSDAIRLSNIKRIDTVRKKYNVDNVMQHHDIKNKMVNTFITKHNVHNPFKLDYVQEKTRDTLMRKYGVCTPMKSPIVHNKQIATMLALYGVSHPSLSEKCKNEKLHSRHINMLYALNKKLVKYKCVAMSYDGKQNGFVYNCNVCGNECNESWQFVNVIRLNNNTTPCTYCVPKNPPYSYIEREFSDWVISNINCDYMINNRSIINGELDLYIPNLKIAFEFNGIYYHSELFKGNNYHINKTINCANIGIRLIHIWEDDWLYKQNIIKSIILSILNKTQRLYARKCELKEVSYKEASQFLDENHLQGTCKSSVQLGLYYNNELVSIMTFGKSRFERNVNELLRYCNKLNTTVVGAPSKLFKFYINNYNIENIVSYADRSWSVGFVYEKLGFEFDSYTEPGYSYIENGIRNNRMNYQKHKLIKRGFVGNTEHEMTNNAGIYRIYDCGNYKYKWIRK